MRLFAWNFTWLQNGNMSGKQIFINEKVKTLLFRIKQVCKLIKLRDAFTETQEGIVNLLQKDW